MEWNPQHLDYLEQGPEVWNRWRKDTPNLVPMLAEVDLTGRDLQGFNLAAVRLTGASLIGANLHGVNLSGSWLVDAKLNDAILSETVLHFTHFHSAHLNGAKLVNADLTDTIFSGSDLSDANLQGAILQATIFSNTNLSGATGLGFCEHLGPSYIDIRTIQRSSPLPSWFLRDCGLPESVSHQPESFILGIDEKSRLHSSGANISKKEKIFIGHGRSLLWLKLRMFLIDKLQLDCDEFNEESTAGTAITTRLQSMLDQAQFAFLLMTCEDTHADGSVHARENVIHEAGLFQGRLGFNRAIILLEEGCVEFSNIHGLGQIHFPKGNLDTVFEKIRDVLKRERIIL